MSHRFQGVEDGKVDERQPEAGVMGEPRHPMSTKHIQLLTLLCAGGVGLLSEGYLMGGISAIAAAAMVALGALDRHKA